jgi:hypothetical protein
MELNLHLISATFCKHCLKQVFLKIYLKIMS